MPPLVSNEFASRSLKTLTCSQESFDQLIDYFEANGNPVVGKRWRVDKEGWHCCVRYPIDWDRFYADFQFDPAEIMFYENSIVTTREWLEVTYRAKVQD